MACTYNRWNRVDMLGISLHVYVFVELSEWFSETWIGFVWEIFFLRNAGKIRWTRWFPFVLPVSRFRPDLFGKNPLYSLVFPAGYARKKSGSFSEEDCFHKIPVNPRIRPIPVRGNRPGSSRHNHLGRP